MNHFKYFKDKVSAAVHTLGDQGTLPPGLDTDACVVEPPRDPSHGDLATNAAMVLAKQARMKPRDIAELLASELAKEPGVSGTEVAGPGFLNLRLEHGFWHDRLRDLLAAGAAYGDSDIGGSEAVNVEYVSANPTGPLHVGHCRGAVYGDALASLLEKAGYQVTREYYVNDAGAQVDVLARSAHLRYREALGEEIGAIPDGLYPGDYLKPVGAALADRDGDKWRDAEEAEWLEPVRQFTIDAMLDLIREDLAALGIVHEVFFSERSLQSTGRIQETVGSLENQGLIYVGVLEPPKGRKPEDWEPRPQTLFRSTQFGDDVDRPLKKSDGSWTYFAPDIAYHYDKFQRGFRQMILVLGADHSGYIKRMKAAVAAVSEGQGDLDIKICQLVNLLDRGEPVKMSKRAGSFVTVRDVVDQVGKDVVRFIMLTRKNDAPLDFDFAKVTEQSKDNPVFYVQYAHARAHSVLRNARADYPNWSIGDAELANADLGGLSDDDELALIKIMAGWPRAVESAALAHEPHRIAFFMADVAAAFHGLWTKGKEAPQLRFIIPDQPELTAARLAMVRAVAIVIGSGLAIMGVEPVTEM